MTQDGAAGKRTGMALFGILMFGSLWGLIEASVGVALRGTCGRLYCGSILTGCSLLFFSGAFVVSRRVWLLMLLPVIAGLFRLYTGFLLHQRVVSGAVANPIYAFFVEGLVFCALIWIVREQRLGSLVSRGVAGAAAAGLAAVFFVPVKLFTTIPACVVPWSSTPLAIWGMPVAMAFGAAAMPLGFALGQWVRGQLLVSGRREALLVPLGAAASIVCLLLVTFIHVR